MRRNDSSFWIPNIAETIYHQALEKSSRIGLTSHAKSIIEVSTTVPESLFWTHHDVLAITAWDDPSDLFTD